MLKKKTYRYVIDLVTRENLPDLRKALAVVPTITGIDYSGTSQILSVEASSNPRESIRLACEVVGARMRGEVKNR